MDALGKLSASTLAALAAKVERGTLSPPYTELGLDVVDAAMRLLVAADLEELRRLGVQPRALGIVLRSLAQQRSHAQDARDGVELVWTGPDVGASHARDAAVVAAELFARAERSVLVATYALYNGRQVLHALARRMDEVPELKVTMVVNIEREKGETRDGSELIRKFGERFREKEWPGSRFPDVYFDPRALHPVGAAGRAVMHAKCVVIDDRWILVTSANFTEAAHGRNVEVGLVLDRHSVASMLTREFERLVRVGALEPVAHLEGTHVR